MIRIENFNQTLSQINQAVLSLTNVNVQLWPKVKKGNYQ